MYSIGQEAQGIQEALWKSLQEEARRAMEGALNRMMEAERMIFVGVAPYERSAARRGRRNGYDGRSLDSRWGPLRVRIPKVRQSGERFRTRILRAYQRRQEALDQLALEWVACGMSTRAVSDEMYQAFGALVSPGTISALVGQVDAERAAFHQRRFVRGYRYVFLDGKHGKVSRPSGRRGRGPGRSAALLLAWGIRHGGSEELIDFRVAPDESEASWSDFLLSLRDRGLVEENRFGERLERFISDGDGGIEAALAMVYPETPKQVCVFHKIKNLLGDLTDKSCKAAIQGEAGAIFEASHRAEALARLGRWKRHWEAREPIAVGHFLRDLDRMLLFYESEPSLRRRLKTSNPIERFILELDRKFERIGAFPSSKSWDRTTFIVYRQLVHRGYAPIQHAVPFTRTS
jgi:putative transposase